MEKNKNKKQKNLFYGHKQAINKYKLFKNDEKIFDFSNINLNECIVVRLDGKGLSKRFKNKNEIFLFDFYDAMNFIVTNIKTYCEFVDFAYSFNDEISFLINKDYIRNNKFYSNRLEKLISILSGYVSAIFSQKIDIKLKKYCNESFSFDARVIIFPKHKAKEYFISRQYFAISSFIDRLYFFYKVTKHSRTIANIKKILNENNIEFNETLHYICFGIVAFEKTKKWTVETARESLSNFDKSLNLIKV